VFPKRKELSQQQKRRKEICNKLKKREERGGSNANQLNATKQLKTRIILHHADQSAALQEKQKDERKKGEVADQGF